MHSSSCHNLVYRCQYGWNEHKTRPMVFLSWWFCTFLLRKTTRPGQASGELLHSFLAYTIWFVHFLFFVYIAHILIASASPSISSYETESTLNIGQSGADYIDFRQRPVVTADTAWQAVGSPDGAEPQLCSTEMQNWQHSLSYIFLASKFLC